MSLNVQKYYKGFPTEKHPELGNSGVRRLNNSSKLFHLKR